MTMLSECRVHMMNPMIIKVDPRSISNLRRHLVSLQFYLLHSSLKRTQIKQECSTTKITLEER